MISHFIYGVPHVTEWVPPARLYERECGDYRIVLEDRKPGLYRIRETSGGPVAVMMCEPFTATCLKKGDEYLHCDEPLFWYGEIDMLRKTRGGRYLIAGLGLGLEVRLLMSRSSVFADVESVVIVEKSQEVIDLVWSQIDPLSNSHKFEIVCADIFDFKYLDPFDVVIVDIWHGSRFSKDNQESFARAFDHVNRYWPYAQQIYHGAEGFTSALGADKLMGDIKNEERS